jgi:hypothetical protein
VDNMPDSLSHARSNSTSTQYINACAKYICLYLAPLAKGGASSPVINLAVTSIAWAHNYCIRHYFRVYLNTRMSHLAHIREYVNSRKGLEPIMMILWNFKA